MRKFPFVGRDIRRAAIGHGGEAAAMRDLIRRVANSPGATRADNPRMGREREPMHKNRNTLVRSAVRGSCGGGT